MRRESCWQIGGGDRDNLCKYGESKYYWSAGLVPHRIWLNQFFRIAQGETREAILKALRAAQSQFPK